MGMYNDDDSQVKAPSLARVAHYGDPCIYCGIPRDEVEPGPCPYLVNYEKQIQEADKDARRGNEVL